MRNKKQIIKLKISLEYIKRKTEKGRIDKMDGYGRPE
jgi:hypothetical protein